MVCEGTGNPSKPNPMIVTTCAMLFCPINHVIQLVAYSNAPSLTRPDPQEVIDKRLYHSLEIIRQKIDKKFKNIFVDT